MFDHSDTRITQLKAEVLARLKQGETLNSNDKEGSSCVRYTDQGYEYRYEGQMGELETRGFEKDEDALVFIRATYSYSAPHPRTEEVIWFDILTRLRKA